MKKGARRPRPAPLYSSQPIALRIGQSVFGSEGVRQIGLKILDLRRAARTGDVQDQFDDHHDEAAHRQSHRRGRTRRHRPGHHQAYIIGKRMFSFYV